MHPGDWWHGFVKDQQSKGLTPTGDAFSAATGSRVFDVRRRPEARAGGAAGVTPAQTIFVTQDDVQAWPNDDVNQAEIVWSDAPLAGQVAMFRFS